MNNRLPSIVALVSILAVTVVSSMFVVDETQLAIVTQFGEFKFQVDQPGIYFKLPFVQKVNRMERRIMGSDNPPSSYLTLDKKRLQVDPITRWRIVDPLKFYTTVRDELGAKARLDDIINSELRRELARTEFTDIVCIPADTPVKAPGPVGAPGAVVPSDPVVDVPPLPAPSAAAPAPSVAPGPALAPSAAPPGLPSERGAPRVEECGREAVMAAVTKRVVEQSERYGILVLDVRMKRTDLPAEVQESVFQRMKAERERVAKGYRAQGEEEAQRIRAETDKEVRLLLAAAYEKAQKAQGRGDAESINIYADAYGKDPEFYSFIRSLGTYEEAVGKHSSLVLSTGSPLFRFLEDPRVP